MDLTPIPETLADLVAEVLPPPGAGVPTHPPSDLTALPAKRHGITSPSYRSERLKVKAFERFVEGLNIKQISRELGCTHQYLYQVAKDEDWVARRTHLKTTALLTDGMSAKALEMAMSTLQSKLATRLQELDDICSSATVKTGIRVKAILAWLTMAGVGKGVELDGPPPPPNVGVVNDFSDRRQVTVVQGKEAEDTDGE